MANWFQKIFDPHGVKPSVRRAVNTYRTHLSDALSGTGSDAGAMVDAAREAAEKAGKLMTEKVGAMHEKAITKALERETEKVLKGGFVKRNVTRLGKTAKWGAIGAAGLAAVGLIAASMRRGKSEKSHVEPEMAMVPPMMDPYAVPPMVAGPAEGRAPNEWQARMRPDAAPAAEPQVPGRA